MPQQTYWTPRDAGLLEALVLRVRVLTTQQIAALWWPAARAPYRNVTRRLARLVDEDWLDRARANVHPLLPLERAECLWSPGDEPPDAAAVAWRLRRRWSQPPVPTVVYAASRRTARLFGGYRGGVPKALDLDHDVHLAQVFVQFAARRPERLTSWLGEAAFPKAGYHIKDPDAFLMDDDGHVARVIEFGGRYDASRVLAFHEHCAERELPYELW